MKTGILVKIGKERVDIVDLTKKELEGWLDGLTNAQKNRLVETLLDLIRALPRTITGEENTQKVHGSDTEGSA